MKHKAIAICGLIGSGKSAVGSYLDKLGYTVVDCDDIARQLATDSNIIAQVQALLGECSISQGQLDRGYIRSVVFADSALLAQYSNIFSSGVADRVLDIISNNSIVFVQLPIYDAIPYSWHSVWNVVCNQDIRLHRTIARDNTSAQDVMDISNQQQPVMGTVTIDNCGTLQQLYDNIDRLLLTL